MRLWRLAQDEYPGGFDAIVGADVVYAAEHVPALFAAAAALLAPDPPIATSSGPVSGRLPASGQVMRPALVLLCYTARR